MIETGSDERTITEEIDRLKSLLGPLPHSKHERFLLVVALASVLAEALAQEASFESMALKLAKTKRYLTLNAARLFGLRTKRRLEADSLSPQPHARKLARGYHKRS